MIQDNLYKKNIYSVKGGLYNDGFYSSNDSNDLAPPPLQTFNMINNGGDKMLNNNSDDMLNNGAT